MSQQLDAPASDHLHVAGEQALGDQKTPVVAFGHRRGRRVPVAGPQAQRNGARLVARAFELVGRKQIREVSICLNDRNGR